MDSHTKLEHLHERVVKLEQQNRRLKHVGAVVLTVAAAMMVTGQAPAKKTAMLAFYGNKGEPRGIMGSVLI